MTGAGRLAGVEAIARAVTEVLGIRHDLEEQTVLVTAGPTCEDLDPVRFLTNRSSGRMGYALADAAARRGARVVLVSGPTALAAPAGVERVDVRTTEQMHRAVLARLSEATIVIMAAAVADYRPVAPNPTKIKRGAGASDRLTIELEATPDILADVARVISQTRPQTSPAALPDHSGRILVGFAAETDHLAEHARRKLAAKSADLIVANDVTAEGAGFDHETNIVTLFTSRGDEISLPRMSKFDVAQRILDQVIELLRAPARPTAKIL